MKAAVVSSTLILAHRSAAQETPAEKRVSLTVAEGPRDLPEGPAIRLTPRQLEVLALLCEGLPNKLICRQLNISAGTVKAHISGILRELGVTSRLQAVVAARRSGLLGESRKSAAHAGEELRSGVSTPSAETVRALDLGARALHRLSLSQHSR